MRHAADEVTAMAVIIDAGPNLGAINRAALLAADLFSLQGLRNLGPAMREWRRNWQEQAAPRAPSELDLPPGTMGPLGYVVLQHAVRLDRPVKAYERWFSRIRPADGALGSHGRLVQICFEEFRALADRVAERAGLAVPVEAA
jgi:hypothetical protein